MEPSFQTGICECPDVNASTMAIDVSGRHVLLTGRKAMVLVDLDADVGTSQNQQQQAQQESIIDPGIPTASPKSLALVKRHTRNSKYEPTASHFSRHMADLFALTTYQVVEVFSIEDLNPMKPRLMLRGHSRAITDVEWSHSDPYLLGSSAADCLTNLWDIRDSRRPSASLSSVSGATHVRFSKTSNNLIATSHEIDIRIWDIRQPNLPLYYIAAHLQKINGMDWNPSKTNCDQDQLITCSQDNTIKLWDLNASKIKPSSNFSTRSPAWRIRYTPISADAIATSTLPQLRSRNECLALKLWSMKTSRYEQKKLELILGLVGHNDVIIDFDWRARTSSSDCELVSWSKDRTLRVWRVDHRFIEMNVDNSDYEGESEQRDVNCGCIETGSVDDDNVDVETTIDNPSLTESQLVSRLDQMNDLEEDTRATSSPLLDFLSNKDDHLGQPSRQASGDSEEDFGNYIGADENSPNDNFSSVSELRQEFNLLNKNIPNIEFEELNSLRRICLVTARAKNLTCRLRIALPPSYPHTDCPTFTLIDSNPYGGESLDKDSKERLLSILDETAQSQLSRGRNCLEPCLRKFIAELQKLTSLQLYGRKRPTEANQEYKYDPITLSSQRDHSVPFPSTSGARFCGNLLVCYGRPLIPSLNKQATGGETSANWLVETPRSMAQLSAQLDNMRRQGSYNLSTISISYFYYGAMRRTELQNRSKNIYATSRINSKYISNRNKSILQAQSMSKSYKCGPVVIYDVSNLLGGLSKELAENYVFDKDVIKMCRRNAQVAADHNRKDLVQVWSLAELSSEGVLNSFKARKDQEASRLFLLNHNSDFGDRPWTMHPFGSKLIQSLIDHYVYNCHDVQTAAMLVWTFSSPKLERSSEPQNESINLMNSNNQVVRKISNTMDTISHDGWGLVSSLDSQSNQVNSSNSWANNSSVIYENSISNSEKSCYVDVVNIKSKIVKQRDDYLTNEDVIVNTGNSTTTSTTTTTTTTTKFTPKFNILNPERGLQNDLIMHIYAELLYRLNLLNQRAMILKDIGSNSAYSELFSKRPEPIRETSGATTTTTSSSSSAAAAGTATTTTEETLPNLINQCFDTYCRNKCRSNQCPSCKKLSLYCSVCRLPVKGCSSACLKCLHGGHVKHFNSWFESYDFCPTGCGCKCLEIDS